MITAQEAREICFNVNKNNILYDLEEKIKDAAYKGEDCYITDIKVFSVIANDIEDMLSEFGYEVYYCANENGERVLMIEWRKD